MFKLMEKKIIAILRKLFLLNWPYDFCRGGSRLVPVSNVIFCSKTDISKIAIYKLYLEKFLAWTSALNLTIREDRIFIR